MDTTDKKHYWEKVNAVGTCHNFDIEKKVFKKLVEQKVINLV